MRIFMLRDGAPPGWVASTCEQLRDIEEPATARCLLGVKVARCRESGDVLAGHAEHSGCFAKGDIRLHERHLITTRGRLDHA